MKYDYVHCEHVLHQREVIAMQAYQYKANAPQAALQDYMRMIKGDYGGTERSTAPSQFGSSFMGALGKGLATGITGGLF